MKRITFIIAACCLMSEKDCIESICKLILLDENV